MKTSCILLLFAASVHGQDFYWNTVSARSLGLGGIYVPSTTGVLDALAANPAGLSAIGAPSIDANLTTVFARGSFTDSVNAGSPLKTPPGVFPYGAIGTPIGHSRVSVGVGIVPDLLSVSQWRYVDAPGVAGTSYGLQTQKSAIIAGRG